MPNLLFIHALSPLHAGTGTAVGAVDLPIARDKATGIPYVPGSSVKGSLRARAQELSEPDVFKVFGPDRPNASDHAGALVVGDANLLLLPVRSLAGTFAYVTSPFLLQRFARDAKEAGLLTAVPVPIPADDQKCSLAAPSWLELSGKVILEELDFTREAAQNQAAGALAQALAPLLFPRDEDAAWRDGLCKRLCVVHDDVMAYLSEHATDVVAHIALDPNTKTVDSTTGALWYEESLPTESILVSLVAVMNNGQINPADVVTRVRGLLEVPIQLGGGATVGQGRCRLVLGGGK